MANEFYLPQEITNHIQSFLNARDQAQSSVLAKSWYISCPTRPVLVFDESKFSRLSHKFSEFCTETLKEYKTQNLKLDKFTLKMIVGEEIKSFWMFRENFPFQGICKNDFSLRNKLAGELIISALELGAPEIELKLKLIKTLRYNLPVQVFGYTSLIHLSVDRYVIDGVIGDRVLCSRLKSLVFDNVKTTDDVVRDILLECPLIENLNLYCQGLENVNVSKQLNLVEFRACSVRVEFMDGRNVIEFRYLRKLDFNSVKLGDDFFTKFSSMFPYIEDVTLSCGYCQVVNISSNSLRHLSLSSGAMLKKVQLNVPNISKFQFRADYNYDQGEWDGNLFKPLPSLYFDNVPRDWESDVTLLFYAFDVIEPFLLAGLNKFLTQMTRSRISLSISFDGLNVMSEEEIPCFPFIPVVENLKVCSCCSDTTESIVLGLSRSCCPKLITKCKGCPLRGYN